MLSQWSLWVLSVWHLQGDGYVFDSAAVASRYEFRFEVLITEAIHLTSLCPNKELLALSS